LPDPARLALWTVGRSVLRGLLRTWQQMKIREKGSISWVDFLNLLTGLHEALGAKIPEADYGKLDYL